jgi:hypothetical protein
VQAAIRRQLNPLIYVDMHNVTCPRRMAAAQIDHLIFSPYGLFVLETKNFQGWIFGTEKQREWTQQIFRKRSRFQNPLRQNYKHIKTLQSLLDIAPASALGDRLVGDCEFKTEMPAHVTRGLGFVGHIQSFTQPVWAEQMQALLDKLGELRLQRSCHRQAACGACPATAGGQQGAQTPQTLAGAGGGSLGPTGQAARTRDGGYSAGACHVGAAFGRVDRESVSAGTARPASRCGSCQMVDTAAEAAEPVCPQCEWPLRKLLMQRGPLAGQAVWRCTNAAACSFVRGHV